MDVVKANLCVGCGICEALSNHTAIQLRIDSDGFYRPVITGDTSELWATIKEICPGIVLRQEHNSNAGKLARLWGPVKLGCLGHSTDPQLRWRASSGGALSAFLIYLLETKQVDYILQCGAGESTPSLLPTMHVSYTAQDVIESSGSRYAPTAPLVDIRNLLDKDNSRLAFVGKPCDIAALRSYIKTYYDTENRFIVCVSFFCAGIPSLFATHKVISTLGLELEDVKAFRYRGFGWPGYATAIDRNGREWSMSYENSWVKILGREIQFRCRICPDGMGEMADIAFGDAWYIKDGSPDFQERPGRNVIIARTTKGLELLHDAVNAKYIETSEFSLSDLEAMQPYQRTRRRTIAARLLALWLLGKATPHYSGFYMVRNAWESGILSFGKQFLGMLHRLLQKQSRQ